MEHARILIVEDEPLIAEDLRAMLEELGLQVCGMAVDADAAIAKAEQERPDLALLDIRLSGKADGIAVAASLTAMEVPFLYITSHTDPATMARVAATRPEGFIIKPFEFDDLRTQLTVVLARMGATERPGHIVLRDKGRLVRVSVADILYAEADDNYTTLYTNDRKYVLVSSLSALEERIGGTHLTRVHRKYAVDMRRVTGMEGGALHIGTMRIPIGRTHLAEVQRLFGLSP
jgi:DNA-binding LytR/AlgR family response regulator